MANLWLGQYAGSRAQLHLPSYISGYVDGEGCFNVSMVLLLMQEYFGGGWIGPDRSDKTVKWETRNLTHLLERILPHFRRHPLLSAKQQDFELFDAVCTAISRRNHRTSIGCTRSQIWRAA